ncbi:Uncharacterised protein [Leclercia adecarboxylata]|uniref:Uncharacterized protein n=1 Tax=Leclercia adecarboxylata TaxID=83655 RepID=A0A4U9HEQ9_9ENTR|nr:Uncharacterised protein [Leclercia adecarboxylata]
MKKNDFDVLTAQHSAPVKMWTHGVPVEQRRASSC